VGLGSLSADKIRPVCVLGTGLIRTVFDSRFGLMSARRLYRWSDLLGIDVIKPYPSANLMNGLHSGFASAWRGCLHVKSTRESQLVVCLDEF
jgi:hypothetical protein